MLPSDARVCRCEGWWEQQYYGRQPMENLQLSFSNQMIVGQGQDIVGPFELRGLITPTGSVQLRKKYLQKHEVMYLGTYDGEGTMAGNWRIGELSGRWLISLRRSRAQVLDHEIKEITPL